MKSIRLLAVAAGLAAAIALSGCAVLDNLVHGDVGGAAASVGDTLVTPAIHAPIANSAAAAENLYSGAQNVLTASLKNHVITKTQGLRIDPYVDKVYAVVVELRAVQNGQDVTVLLRTFNRAFGDLFRAAHAEGVTLPTAADPATP
jgi:hypothetical protein